MQFVGAEEVWNAIRDLDSKCREKKVAVPYVTSDVVLKFGKGDLIIVNATDEAVRCGQTSSHVLKRALMRGARVVSVPTLHAKVMLFGDAAFVGSANVSMRSVTQLIEAGCITKQRSTVSGISRWIDELADKGEPVDEKVLKRLLSITPTRRTTKRSFEILADPHIVFFKQVMVGDIRKYKAQSSISGTGGGARDLRLSPSRVFGPVLRKMFAERTSDKRVTYGNVLSYGGRQPSETRVELWSPTKARPRELRISRFYEVPGWEVDERSFRKAKGAGQKMFYVLEMDTEGTIAAKVMSVRQLSRSNASVGAHIMRVSANSPPGRSIIGAVDVVRGTTFP